MIFLQDTNYHSNKKAKVANRNSTKMLKTCGKMFKETYINRRGGKLQYCKKRHYSKLICMSHTVSVRI